LRDTYYRQSEIYFASGGTYAPALDLACLAHLRMFHLARGNKIHAKATIQLGLDPTSAEAIYETDSRYGRVRLFESADDPILAQMAVDAAA
jgi:hypothetical protein